MPSVAKAGNAPNRQSKSGAKTIRIEFARERRDFGIYSRVESAASRPDAFRAQPDGSSQSKSALTSCPAKGENSFNGPVIPSEVEGSSRGSFKVTLTGSLDGARDDARFRSEERRVGKECRSSWE